MVKDEVKEAIRSVVKPNDVKGITAEDLANVLELMVDGCEPSGGGDSNTFYLYIPVSLDDGLATGTLEGLKQIFDIDYAEVPVEIREAWNEIVDAWIAHNKEMYPIIVDEVANGHDVNIVLCYHLAMTFLIYAYLLDQLQNTEEFAPEEMLVMFEECLKVKSYINPQFYEVNDLINGVSILVDTRIVNLQDTGDWEKGGESGYYTLDLHCEGEDIRMDEFGCKKNKKAIEFPPAYNEIVVFTDNGKDGYSGKHYVLIEKSSGSEDNFPTLEGGTTTRKVVRYKYLDGLDMYEVQIAKDDGYGRKVKLGTIQLV
jgi:hypothetical protein